ncbi:Molybdenum transport ATP-binding protein ModC [Nitrincola lacisaponensis]|uniref:Molybdenum transport ATP-binding protein ModC n=1 Tax=Nitrincola lacisaponensis TaxID=267850 RepID=A0A063Y2R2_9GAMM|nr:ABC transporter ATP-binding protein [Nitrincola lacisaponensis]KDE38822.1 Molybdenum transport ATP-binding protein ModC [Nitrincola lacisaponensis]
MSPGLEVSLRAQGQIPLEMDLRCAPGEILALIGPSGSGKTTLLRALAGLYTQVSGQIRCQGRTWLDSQQGLCLKPEQRWVGMVFQQYALFPHLTALQNLTLAMSHLPRQAREPAALAWLERVNLAGLHNRLSSQLSGGQRQRVALARALASKPDLLLLDEPFSAVDQVTRFRLRRELALLRKQIDIPMLLVTHDLDEALQLADRICVLHHGQQLQCADPISLMQHPASPDVARLLGLQNIFSASVVAVGREGLSLDWAGCPIKVSQPSEYAIGDQVTWIAPPQSILLQRPDRPVPGDSENPIAGSITELVLMGPHASVRVLPNHAPELPLSFFIPLHYVERQQLHEGMPVTLSLKAHSLHVF